MEHNKTPARKPKANVSPIQDQLAALEADMLGTTMDSMTGAPRKESEPQYKIAQQDINDSSMYLKPVKMHASREPFNEKFRDSYEFDKKYVQMIAQHNECKGDSIDMWCKPYPGVPATEWIVPVGVPVYVPRFVAEQIKRKFYHTLKMETKPIGDTQHGTYYGAITVKETVNRIDCQPCTNRKSLFFSEEDFKDYKPTQQEVVNG